MDYSSDYYRETVAIKLRVQLQSDETYVALRFLRRAVRSGVWALSSVTGVTLADGYRQAPLQTSRRRQHSGPRPGLREMPSVLVSCGGMGAKAFATVASSSVRS